MKKTIYSFILTIFTYFLAAGPALAAIEIQQPKTNGGVQVGSEEAPALLTRTIGNAIGLIFTFSAIAFVAVFFWGVVDWIMAAGDKESIAKARNKITQAIVGLIVLSLSFVIMAVVAQITGINLLGDMALPSFMNP